MSNSFLTITKTTAPKTAWARGMNLWRNSPLDFSLAHSLPAVHSYVFAIKPHPWATTHYTCGVRCWVLLMLQLLLVLEQESSLIRGFTSKQMNTITSNSLYFLKRFSLQLDLVFCDETKLFRILEWWKLILSVEQCQRKLSDADRTRYTHTYKYKDLNKSVKMNVFGLSIPWIIDKWRHSGQFYSLLRKLSSY